MSRVATPAERRSPLDRSLRLQDHVLTEQIGVQALIQSTHEDVRARDVGERCPGDRLARGERRREVHGDALALEVSRNQQCVRRLGCRSQAQRRASGMMRIMDAELPNHPTHWICCHCISHRFDLRQPSRRASSSIASHRSGVVLV
jgi:hypothetical protein